MSQTQNNTQAGAVAESYARAMFELAVEAGSMDTIGAELGQLAGLLEEHPDLAALFAHQAMDTKRRAATIEKLFKGRLSPHVLNLLLVLNRKGRLGQLAGIARAFDAMAKTKRGEVDVEVHTAKPLDADQLDQVAARISKSIGKKALVIQKVNAALIGGLKIRIGDQLIDGSVATQLRRMARQLDEKGHEHVRTSAARLLTA